MTVKMKIEGLRELEEALADLGKATARNTLKRALKPYADAIRDEMKAQAPVDTGALSASVVSTPKTPKKIDAGRAAYADAMRRSGGDKGLAARAMREARRENATHFARMFVGVAGGRASIAHIVEWGTSERPGTGFARRSWDMHKAAAVDGIRQSIVDEIEKSKARAARKAARLLAKSKG